MARSRPRPRRTHAERTAETRGKVLRAVVESITEVGFPRTTAAEIARRAGVTWGAVQHHFGDKDGILLAVLDASFARFAEALGAAPPPEVPLAQRVGLFVDRAWRHFSSSHYRSTFEILLNLPDTIELSWREEMVAPWRRIWSEYFPESPASARETVELMRYTIAVLQGLAATGILEDRGARLRPRGLGFLKETLVRELEAGAASRLRAGSSPAPRAAPR